MTSKIFLVIFIIFGFHQLTYCKSNKGLKVIFNQMNTTFMTDQQLIKSNMLTTYGDFISKALGLENVLSHSNCNDEHCGLMVNGLNKVSLSLSTHRTKNLGWIVGDDNHLLAEDFSKESCVTPFIVTENDTMVWSENFYIILPFKSCSDDGVPCKECSNGCIYNLPDYAKSMGYLRYGTCASDDTIMLLKASDNQDHENNLIKSVLEDIQHDDIYCLNSIIHTKMDLISLCDIDCEVVYNHGLHMFRINDKQKKFGAFRAQIRYNSSTVTNITIDCDITDLCSVYYIYSRFLIFSHPSCVTTIEIVFFYIGFVSIIWISISVFTYCRCYRYCKPCYNIYINRSIGKTVSLANKYDLSEPEVIEMVQANREVAHIKRSESNFIMKIIMFLLCINRVDSCSDIPIFKSDIKKCLSDNSSCIDDQWNYAVLSKDGMSLCLDNMKITVLHTAIECIPELLYYTPVTTFESYERIQCDTVADCDWQKCSEKVLKPSPLAYKKLLDYTDYPNNVYQSCKKSSGWCLYGGACLYDSLVIHSDKLMFAKVSRCSSLKYVTRLQISKDDKTSIYEIEDGVTHYLPHNISIMTISDTFSIGDLKLVEYNGYSSIMKANDIGGSNLYDLGFYQCSKDDLNSECQWSKTLTISHSYRKYKSVNANTKSNLLTLISRNVLKTKSPLGQIQVPDLTTSLYFSKLAKTEIEYVDNLNVNISKIEIHGNSYLTNKCFIDIYYSCVLNSDAMIKNRLFPTKFVGFDKSKYIIRINTTCRFSNKNMISVKILGYHFDKEFNANLNLTHPFAIIPDYTDIIIDPTDNNGVDFGDFSFPNILSFFNSLFGHWKFIITVIIIIIIIILIKKILF